jgi:hypothetical protein
LLPERRETQPPASRRDAAHQKPPAGLAAADAGHPAPGPEIAPRRPAYREPRPATPATNSARQGTPAGTSASNSAHGERGKKTPASFPGRAETRVNRPFSLFLASGMQNLLPRHFQAYPKQQQSQKRRQQNPQDFACRLLRVFGQSENKAQHENEDDEGHTSNNSHSEFKSSQRGFTVQISFTFFSRRQPLSCFPTLL